MPDLAEAIPNAAITEKLGDTEGLRHALHEGVRKAVYFHQRMGTPVVVWESGKSVHIPAAEMLAAMDEAERIRNL